MTDFEVSWHWLMDDKLDDFVDTGVVVVDDLFCDKALIALQRESGFIPYKEATLIGGQRSSDVRGDRIHWIDECCPAGMHYLSAINQLGEYFNQFLYAGIRHCEAHYAHYPSGFGYQWHKDNPQGRDERVISAVFYLNDDWTDEDGGQISVYDKHDNFYQLSPRLNRLVLFDSNLLHQVEITRRHRFSIATWLRRDRGVM